MTAPWKALAEPFDPALVKSRQGPGGRMLSYVDARAVMQRLDDVLTPSGWDFTSTVIPGTDIVRGELTIAGVTRVDYGYPNSDRDEEPIKAASSDAIKRCAVMFGIGRHLYEDNSASGGRAGSSSPARPSAPPRNAVVITTPAFASDSGPLPPEPDWMDQPRQEFPPIATAQPGDLCDEHGEPWHGETGDLFHEKPGWTDPKDKWHRHPGNAKKTARRAS